MSNKSGHEYLRFFAAGEEPFLPVSMRPVKLNFTVGGDELGFLMIELEEEHF